MIYEYNIPLIPPSLNRYAGRKNEWDYRANKREWIDIVSVCCRPVPPRPIEQSRVTLSYYFADRRRRDPDNYSGKMILDGLTKAGIIADDSFGHIELTLCGRYDKINSHVEIIIEEGL